VEELHWYNKVGVPPLAETLIVADVPLQMVWSGGWELIVGLAATFSVMQLEVVLQPEAAWVTTTL